MSEQSSNLVQWGNDFRLFYSILAASLILQFIGFVLYARHRLHDNRPAKMDIEDTVGKWAYTVGRVLLIPAVILAFIHILALL